jgi:hypothetical protein
VSWTSPPYAVLVDPPLLASVQAARPIVRKVLLAWLDEKRQDENRLRGAS